MELGTWKLLGQIVGITALFALFTLPILHRSISKESGLGRRLGPLFHRINSVMLALVLAAIGAGIIWIFAESKQSTYIGLLNNMPAAGALESLKQQDQRLFARVVLGDG